MYLRAELGVGDSVGMPYSGCIVSVKVYTAWCLWAGSSGSVTVVTHVGGSGNIRYPLANGFYFEGQKFPPFFVMSSPPTISVNSCFYF